MAAAQGQALVVRQDQGHATAGLLVVAIVECGKDLSLSILSIIALLTGLDRVGSEGVGGRRVPLPWSSLL